MAVAVILRRFTRWPSLERIALANLWHKTNKRIKNIRVWISRIACVKFLKYPFSPSNLWSCHCPRNLDSMLQIERERLFKNCINCALNCNLGVFSCLVLNLERNNYSNNYNTRLSHIQSRTYDDPNGRFLVCFDGEKWITWMETKNDRLISSPFYKKRWKVENSWWIIICL